MSKWRGPLPLRTGNGPLSTTDAFWSIPPRAVGAIPRARGPPGDVDPEKRGGEQLHGRLATA